MIPTETKKRKITSRHETLRLIREEAIVKFFKRFSGQKLKGSHRKQTRQVERWLDKNKVNIAFTEEKVSFAIYFPDKVTCLKVEVWEDENTKQYKYEYSLEEKEDLMPRFAFTDWE